VHDTFHVVAQRYEHHSSPSSSAPGAKFKVAVVGGGPSGSCAAEILAKNPKIECVLIERKMNNAKPCGGAIPLCMMDEFALPMELVDRKVNIQ
jgi:geranylgeranyl reductase